MLEYNARNIRFLSRMGARGCLGQAIYDLAKDNYKFYVLTADLAHASGFDRIMRDFPQIFYNVGIAEQNLIGVAAGLASSERPVVATTWGMFASVRATDQIRNFMGFMNSNIKLIGMDSGLAQSRFGYSHTNPPDIAILSSIPGINIICPSDGFEIYRAIEEALNHPGPFYIRLTGGELLPIINDNPDYRFEIGKANELKKGKDIAIISCGNLLGKFKEVSKMLEDFGISCGIINMHTLNPIDENKLQSLSENYKLIVAVEDHFVRAGLGSLISEFYTKLGIRVPLQMVGINSFYPPAGKMDYVENVCGLSTNKICEVILNKWRKLCQI